MALSQSASIHPYGCLMTVATACAEVFGIGKNIGQETVAALRNMDPIRTDGEKNGGTGKCITSLLGQLGWDLAVVDTHRLFKSHRKGIKARGCLLHEGVVQMYGDRRQAAWERMGEGQRRHL